MAKTKGFHLPVDVKEYPVYSREEERKVLFEFRYSKDENIRKDAKEKLVLHNMGLIYSIIKDLTTSENDAEPDTLVSYGVEGLISAIEKFDLERETKLGTYAYMWIKKYVRNGIHEQVMVHLPDGMWDNIRVFQRVQNEIKAALGREPSYKPFSIDGCEFSEMEDALVNGGYNFTPAAYKRTVEAWNLKNPSSLNETIEGDRGHELEYVETIEDVEGTKRVETNRRHELMRTEFEKIRSSKIKDADKVADVLLYILEHPDCDEKDVVKVVGLQSRDEFRTLRKRGFGWLRDNSIDLTLQFLEC